MVRRGLGRRGVRGRGGGSSFLLWMLVDGLVSTVYRWKMVVFYAAVLAVIMVLLDHERSSRGPDDGHGGDVGCCGGWWV
jgi:hypothetical protein